MEGFCLCVITCVYKHDPIEKNVNCVRYVRYFKSIELINIKLNIYFECIFCLFEYKGQTNYIFYKKYNG